MFAAKPGILTLIRHIPLTLLPASLKFLESPALLFHSSADCLLPLVE
jgi:hypothetical protein